MRGPRALRFTSLAALVAVTLGLAAPAVGLAQETAAPEVTLELAGQPLWHESNDRLGIRLSITNLGTDALQGFGISVAAYDRVQTRSGLELSGDIDPAFQLPRSSYFRDFHLEIAASGTENVVLDDPLSTLDSLERATDFGVYPLSISLLDANGVDVLARLTTPLLLYPNQLDIPLNVVPVVPINTFAARAPDGSFHPDSTGVIPLLAGLEEDGWLTSLLTTLSTRARRGLGFGIAPASRLIDELADLANGFREGGNAQDLTHSANGQPARAARIALEMIKELIATRGVQPILAPYSFADLPALAARGFEALAQELAVAQTTLQDTLGLQVSRRWVLPPAGRLDTATLRGLRVAFPETVTRTFVSPSALTQPIDPLGSGCPLPSPTFACPISITTVEGSAVGYQADEILQDRLTALAEEGEDRLDLQRFFAELAMIREELPGVSERVVQFTLPGLFRPDPHIGHLFFKGLHKAPWVQTITPAQGLEIAEQRIARELIDPAPPAPHQPDAAYFDQIDEARTVVEHFALIEPPAGLIDRLRRDILVAYSRNWWSDQELLATGLSFAEGARAVAQGHLDNINVLGAPEVTMTSRRGEIQLLLANENDFAVTVALRLVSSQLELANNGLVIREIPPNKSTPVTLAATAQTSGIFLVGVQLETPDGGVVIFGPQDLAIRSTELNRVAVGVTLGALVFLISFYLLRSLRHKRQPDTAEAAGSE